MKRIIKTSAPILLVALLAACTPNKEAQLANLKKQQEELLTKISSLEKEVSENSPVVVKAKAVTVDTMKNTPFNHFIEVQGRLDGEDNVDAFAEAMGVVEEIYVTAGQQVSKGQSLARLNDKAIREQLKAAETSYSLAKDMFEKQQKLWDQKIGSEVQYLQAKTQKEAAEAQLAALKQQASMFTIKSPINGTIELVNLKVGQTASPQMSAFKVVNFSTLKAIATISEAYAQKVNDGDSVKIFFPDVNYELTGKLTFVSKYINPVNRTFEVEVRLKQLTGNMKANMVAVLKINDYKKIDAKTLTINSVQNDKTGSYVWVAKKEGDKLIAQRATVKTGITYNGKVEILSGLENGDLVITNGFLNLKVGDIVKI